VNATSGEGAVRAREIGRPIPRVAVSRILGFASRIRSFATTGRRCREAIALADRMDGVRRRSSRPRWSRSLGDDLEVA